VINELINIKKPNFFIVGAPKSGTTAMWSYLAKHPDIFMSTLKEPHFFGSDLDWNRHAAGLPKTKKEYLSLFGNAGAVKVIGESSVLYLFSQTTAKEIKEFSPDAKILIMLRKPAEMIYSLHSHGLYTSSEDIKEIKEALGAEKERRQGKRIPAGCHCPQALYYKEIARYTEQIERYFNVFGRENVLVIIYVDFKKDNFKLYKDTLRFLGVDENVEMEYEAVNINKKLRSPYFSRFLRSPKTRILRRILIPSKMIRQNIGAILDSFNTIVEERPPVPSKLKKELEEAFAQEVDSLRVLLERNDIFR